MSYIKEGPERIGNWSKTGAKTLPPAEFAFTGEADDAAPASGKLGAALVVAALPGLTGLSRLFVVFVNLSDTACWSDAV